MDAARKPKMPSELTIKRAANGGFIVRHHYDNASAGPSYQPPQEHAFANHAAMLAHVQQHTHGPAQQATRADAPTRAEGATAAKTRGGGVD